MRPLPPEIDSIMAGLRNTSVRPDAELRVLVNAHLDAAHAAAATSPFVDLDRCQQVAATCLALLDAWATLDDSSRRWVQAACLYFADTGDSEDDFASIVGFDDDAEVVNHVAARLGRQDLLIDLD